MTNSSSGLDAIESRFQRRERSIRPPRRPRRQSRDEGKQQAESAEPASADDQPTATAVTTNQEQDSETEPQRHAVPGDLEVEQRQSTGQQTDDELEDAPSEDPPLGQQQGAGRLNEILQHRIEDAMTPVMENLQQQIAEAVRERMQQAQTEQQTRPEVDTTPANAPEPARIQAQEQGQPEVTEARQDTESARPSLPQAVIQSALAALKRALRWLKRTVQKLLHPLKNLPRAVLSLLRMIAPRLGKVLGFVLRAVRQAAGSAVSGFSRGLRTLLARLIEVLVLSPLR